MKPLDVLREEWRVIAFEWSAAHDVANRYDEGRKLLLDEITLRLREMEPGLSLTLAEKQARTSQQFKDYLRSMYDAQRKAQDLRIKMQDADRCYYEQVGQEALGRAEMRLTGAGK
jgi:hypothetical protein